jgi:hypothetical protein
MIRDAEITAIAIAPLNDEVVLGSTAWNSYTGNRAFAVTIPYAVGYPMPMPVYSESTSLVGITADEQGRIVAVGARAAAGGDQVARARYFVAPFEYDTDFANAGSDAIPNAFYFSGRWGMGPAVLTQSSQVRITGIDVPTPISVQGGEYASDWSGMWDCGGAFTTAPGTIQNGQFVCVRHASATTPNTTTTTTLTVGGIAGTFTSETGGPPETEISATPLNSYEARPRFKFYVLGSGGTECQIDGAAWIPCASPYVFDGWTYPNGAHTFAVRAVNAWDPTPRPRRATGRTPSPTR